MEVRVVAALLIALFTSAIVGPVTCGGWGASPMGRRECCQRAHHEHGHDQAKADNCCGGHEQSRQAATTQTVPAAVVHAYAAILVPAFDPAEIEAAARALNSTVTSTRLQDAPHLLVPPLRI